MIRKAIAALGMGALTLLPMQGYASNTNAFGNVVGVFAMANGAVLFSTDASVSARTGIPACGQGNAARWAIDASTTAGQAAVSVLLTAWSQHKRVNVVGSGACNIWSDTETVAYFLVED